MVGMIGYYAYTARSVKFQIARTFLDLEWQVSKGGAVHPRVLEPLISLTLRCLTLALLNDISI